MSDPRLAQIAARYSSIADYYDELWSPIIRPMSAPVFSSLSLPTRPMVLDVGCGTGVLAADVRAVAGDAIVAGLDLAHGMAARAAAQGREHAVAASATAIPFADGTFDLAFSVFVLQHVPDPIAAIAQMGRVVRTGGVGATVTWGPMKDAHAEDVLDEMLTAAGAPPPPRPIDTAELLDDAEKAAAAWQQAGLAVQKTWTDRAEHRWTIDGLMVLATGYGGYKARFESLEQSARSEFLAAARDRLNAMSSEELTWRPVVVFATARR